MNITLLYAILLLAAIGTISAIVLYFVAQKFKVEEDPRIELVAEKLPGANCGGCGKAGCQDMAKYLVESGSMDIVCPVCGSEEWAGVAEILGLDASSSVPKVAVVRCQGGNVNGIKRANYEGYSKCSFANMLHSGNNGCSYGCLGLGDCEVSCPFDAIAINPNTALPEVDEDKCTACGNCVRSCPRGIIELRYKNEDKNRIFVSCVSKDKGAIASKTCKTACIGCSKCAKVCPSEAITISDNLAYIDFEKCTLCGSCVEVCPTHAIVNTPSGRLTII